MSNVIQFTPPHDPLVTFDVYSEGPDKYMVAVNPHSPIADIPQAARAVARFVLDDALQIEQYVEIRLYRAAPGAPAAEVRVEYFDPLAPEFMDQIATAVKMIDRAAVNADDHKETEK